MIVKDEERFLGACLDSVRGVVDEMIVVDTGSTDQTRAIAERAGAQVLDFPWCEDFAAARNAGLEAARGTHILVLDADEVLGPGARKAIKAAVRDKQLAIGMLPLHDADALDAAPQDVVLKGRSMPWPPTHLPRLFKNHARLRYRRRVHETLFIDIAETLRAVGGEILPVRAPIVHYGEIRELRTELDKRERNVRLLRLELEEHPADGDLAGYLANELYSAGDHDGAEEVAKKSLAPFLAELEQIEGPLKPSPIRLASVLATIQLQKGQAADALETARRATAVGLEPHPNLRYLEALALEHLGELQAAEAAYFDCLKMHGKPQTISVNPGATSEAPRVRLANLYVSQGLAEDALEILGGPEAIAGKLETAAKLANAEAQLVLGRPDQALMSLSPLMGTGTETGSSEPPADLFALAATAASMLGQADPSLLDAARSAEPERWLEPRRLALLEAL
jgi:tetratricopeptide (TPR) repeat protein